MPKRRSKPKAKRHTKAWLITWEWLGGSSAAPERIAAVLNQNVHERTIKTVIELLYALPSARLYELVGNAIKPSSRPYKAVADRHGGFTCGHHPWLAARIVEDLTITTDDATGVETVSWLEPRKYKVAGGATLVIEELTPPIPQSITRDGSVPLWQVGTLPYTRRARDK